MKEGVKKGSSSTVCLSYFYIKYLELRSDTVTGLRGFYSGIVIPHRAVLYTDRLLRRSEALHMFLNAKKFSESFIVTWSLWDSSKRFEHYTGILKP